MLSIEFFKRFTKALLICSESHIIFIFVLFDFKLIFKLSSSSFIRWILSFSKAIRFVFLKRGFGILAKSENSLTKFSICFICLLIVKRFLSKSFLSSSLLKNFANFEFNLSIINWIGVRGFLISWASLRATFSQASCLSLRSSLSCWSLNLLVIKLKFLFNCSRSLSVLTSGTLIFKFPLPILCEALIKLLIDLKNLDENLIAILIDKNKSNETIII